MKLQFEQIDRWPPLAWLAICRADDSCVVVKHGSRVEVNSKWFAEAVWGGDYSAGEFDRTDLVFGSGARVRDDSIVFVPSATTVDRLHWIEQNGCTWVSNSLACVLTAVDGDVDPAYPHYFRDFETIIRGTRDYRRTIDTSAGSVQLAYYENVVWKNGQVTESLKPAARRDFSSFEAYYEFVESALCRIGDNMRSAEREHPYQWLATASSGYDSPTVAAIARAAGLKQTLSFTRDRDHRDDSGAEIARRLGLSPITIDSGAWRGQRDSEIPFIASDSKGEDVYYAGAARVLAGRCLLTGYGGTRVWGKGDAPPEEHQRSDQAGLSLCEFRLWAGFVHCPVTYFGDRQTRDLRAISNSDEMKPWDVPGGYSRPICRRVLEEAGVPRSMFGTEKKAASVLLFDRRSFLSAESLADFRQWLSSNVPNYRRSAAQGALRAAARFVQRTAGAAHRVIPIPLLNRIRQSGRLTVFANQEPLFDHIFPWALEKAKQRYAASEPLNAFDTRTRDFVTRSVSEEQARGVEDKSLAYASGFEESRSIDTTTHC